MKNPNARIEYRVNLNGSFRDDVSNISNLTGLSETVVQTLMNKKQKEKYLAQNKPIWQNKKGRWVAYIPDPSKPRGERQISSNDKEALEQKIVDYYKSKDDSLTESTLTLRILYPKWLKHKESISSKATAKSNEKYWKKYYIDEPIIDEPMIDISSNRLKEWVLSLQKSEQMDRTKFGNFSSIIRQMYAYATEEGLIPFNPFAQVKIDWSKLPKREKPSADKQIYYQDEARQMINYCWEQYRKNRQRTQIFAPLAIVFTFYSGLRIGEVVSLRFSDISAYELRVQRMLDSSGVVQIGTKTHEARCVPLVKEALEVIEEVKKRKQEMGLPINGYIFSFDNDYNKDPLRLRTRIQNSLRDYCKELAMENRSMHDIRRTFASFCHEDNISDIELMEYMGHKSIKTTQNSYLLNTKRTKERVKKLQSALHY